MRAHYLQHVPFEGLGSIAPWLAAAGYQTTCTRWFHEAALPEPDAIDLVIVLGGPMSVNDEATLPWLATEKAWLRRCLAADKAVLGICLGAQLIASALGARVYPNATREIGWFPVYGEPTTPPARFRFPTEFEAFHWHGETFDLPPGAVRLARSAACANQAFQWGERVVGLQFHLETTPETVRALVAHCPEDLRPGPWVQPAEQLLATPPERYAAINRLMGELLACLTHR
jgi:GMP synthase-like glutamine amidotransferase